MGFRIPAVALSPYLRRGDVQHGTYGFESILKMISYRFGLEPLNRRVAYAQNIARAFDWQSKPRSAPSLPRPEHVVSVACPGSLGEALPRAKDHDLMNLVTSGYLDRLGFDFKPASLRRRSASRRRSSRRSPADTASCGAERMVAYPGTEPRLCVSARTGALAVTGPSAARWGRAFAHPPPSSVRRAGRRLGGQRGSAVRYAAAADVRAAARQRPGATPWCRLNAAANANSDA
jgi:hypothetical protein